MKVFGVILSLGLLTAPVVLAQTQHDDSQTKHGFVPPNWLKKPSGADLNAVWPKKALERGTSGSATVECLVTVKGLASDCRVISETPAGLGYGSATLLLTPSFVFRPASIDGRPVEAKVTVPINYELNGPVISSALVYHIMQWAPWSNVPGQNEIASAFPKRAVGRGDGHVLLRCWIKADGHLRDCIAATEQPDGRGFARAAIALASKFRLNVVDMPRDHLGNAQVNIPIHFSDPAGADASPYYISEPDWLTSIKPGSVIFPIQAAKAGVPRGTAIVDCNIPASGMLNQCQVVDERPAGMGFGQTAIQAAQSLSVNLWTRDGFPTVGAHVKVPVTLVDSASDSAPSASTESRAKGG